MIFALYVELSLTVFLLENKPMERTSFDFSVIIMRNLVIVNDCQVADSNSLMYLYAVVLLMSQTRANSLMLRCPLL